MQKACVKGHVFEKASDCRACPECERGSTVAGARPKIGAPATRALDNAGVKGLGDLTSWSERDLLALHGMGPKALDILRDHLAAEGLAFKS